jgi:hypothetical protein
MHSDIVQDEGNAIISLLQKRLPTKIDAKEAILELKDADYQWRQMEWIGWYFEYKIFQILLKELGGSCGPVYGNTTFDYKRKLVWDFKSHPILTNKGMPNEPMILNDQEAVEKCIEENFGIGFVVVKGFADFDETGKFKEWHDALKGGKSKYEKERVKRGATSRIRKTAFSINCIDLLFFQDKTVLHEGGKQKWLSSFQEGMRNADGSPRRKKYALWTDRAPDSIRVTKSEKFHNSVKEFNKDQKTLYD